MAELQIKLVNGELAGKTMQDINKQVRDAAVGLSKAKIGTDEYVKANEKLDKAKQLQADMKKQVEATSKASDTLKQSFGGILNQIPGFSQLSGIMGQAKSGVGGLTSGFGILKGAIAATGVGLLVIAFTTLVGWFKKTDEGATLLSGIMKGMGLVFDTVFGKLIDLAKGLGEFFTGKKSIKQGLVDLVDFIGNNLLNRLKSFIVIWKGITDFDLKTVTDGLIQFGSGIENGTDKIAEFGKAIGDAVNEGIEFEKELDRINDRALELSVINAESEKEVSQLLLQSKNVALTYEERIALLDKASEIELRNHQQQLVNARDLEALRKKEIDDNLKKNITNDDLNKAYADAQIARINLDKSSLDLQEKIYNRKTTLVEKETEEIKKYNEQKDKQLQKEVEFSDKRRAKDEENEKSHWNKKAAIAMQGAATNLANQILNNELATDEERKAYADKEKALQDHLDTVAANEDQAKQMLLGETIQLGSDLLNARIQSSKARLDSLKTQFGEESVQYKNAAREEGERIKKAEKQKVALNLIGELSSIWKHAADFGPFATIVAAIQTASALIRANAAQQNINRMKFETGGPVVGPRHSEGGISAELEGGEFIFSRKAVSAIGVNTLSSINRKLTFADGGIVPKNPFDSSRAPMSSNTFSGGASSSNLEAEMKALKNSFDSLSVNIQSWPRTLQVVNNVQDTMKQINVLNQLRNEADV